MRADILKDMLQCDDLAKEIALDCGSSLHNGQWCGECEARLAGIDAYREAMLSVIEVHDTCADHKCSHACRQRHNQHGHTTCHLS